MSFDNIILVTLFKYYENLHKLKSIFETTQPNMLSVSLRKYSLMTQSAEYIVTLHRVNSIRPSKSKTFIVFVRSVWIELIITETKN